MLALLDSWGAKRCWWCVPAVYVGFVPILPTWGMDFYGCGCRTSGQLLGMLFLCVLTLIVLLPLSWSAGRNRVGYLVYMSYVLLPSAGGSLLGFGSLAITNKYGAQVLTPVLVIITAVYALSCSLSWLGGKARRKRLFDRRHCARCRYDLAGLPQLLCPECGWEHQGESESA